MFLVVYPKKERTPQLISKKKLDRIISSGSFIRLSNEHILTYKGGWNSGKFRITRLLRSGNGEITQEQPMSAVIKQFRKIIRDKQSKEPNSIL